MRRRGVALALSGVLAAAALGACGGGGEGASGACGAVERPRAQFPAGHVLPGQPEPSYLSDPPTSGPHVPVVEAPTAVTEPLSRPVQVGLLEAGFVLFQFRPDDLAPDERARLESLAGERVLVAPNRDLPDPVTATAWLHLQRCDQVDTEVLARFAEAYVDTGPGGHVGG